MDLATPAERGEVRAAVAAINATASLLEAERAQVPHVEPPAVLPVFP